MILSDVRVEKNADDADHVEKERMALAKTEAALQGSGISALFCYKGEIMIIGARADTYHDYWCEGRHISYIYLQGEGDASMGKEETRIFKATVRQYLLLVSQTAH